MTENRLSTEELIALGRDREAVVSASTEAAPGTRGRHSANGAAQLGEVIPLLEAVVAGISPDQLAAPTPCAAFTVSGVLQHMVDGATAFAPAFRGSPAPDVAPDPAPDVRLRWRHAIADLLDAVQSPGALDRSLDTPFGAMSGDQFARYVAFDGLMHGWDLATATHQPYVPREELVIAVDAYARQVVTAQLRDGDTFAAEATPVDDTPLARLVAFSGRQHPD